MRPTGWLILAYALFVLLGGIFGYVKAGSTASLIMGVIFAAALSIGAFALLNEKKIGFPIAVATTLLLTTFFIYRFILTYHFMPAGLMSLISLIVLSLLYVKRPRLETPRL